MQEIYLDNSATTRPLPEVVENINNTLTRDYGNPSSLHSKGLIAEKYLKEARKVLAGKLGVDNKEIIFTSGGTESNNLAIKGICYSYSNRGKHLITTEIEHKSVLNVFNSLEKEGFKVTYLKPDKKGNISLDQLKDTVRKDTILVSIMHVNNEIGSIQPLPDISRIIKKINPETFIHVDGVQSFGKILIKPKQWNIDLFTLSGHKIHGPKGVGALYVRNGINLKPLIIGGGQEGNFRSGTENVPAIAGLTPAVKALPDLTEKNPRDQKLDRLRNYFLDKINDEFPAVKINSPGNGAPHIASISFKGIKGEVLLHALSGKGIFVSTGSACHSNTDSKNNVLEAIGLPREYTEGTLRISFAHSNTEEEIDYTVRTMKELLNSLF